jgi:hypothetical protein
MIVQFNTVVLLTSVDIDFNGMDGNGIAFFHNDFLFLLSIREVLAIVEEVQFGVVRDTVW